MLTELKKAINEHQEGDFPTEAILESASSVKDTFLDDPETAMIGAEDDPEIAALIGDIPAYEDGENDEDAKEKVQALTEGLSETILEYTMSRAGHPSEVNAYIEKGKAIIATTEKEMADEKAKNGESAHYNDLAKHLARVKGEIQKHEAGGPVATAKRR